MRDRDNYSLDAALAQARERFAQANPASRAARDRAAQSMPGGNTRSVLHFDPFPLFMVRGEGADVWDIDGHRYADFVGEFSAGLYGHSEPAIKAAIIEALEEGLVLAAPTEREAKLSAAVRARFPSMDLMRFCNSGTEANLMAITTAMAVTGRKRLLVFREAYHGGVLVYAGGGGPLNVPFDTVLADFNDIEGSVATIRTHADDLAAVIVEPILGAGGNIPADPAFLRALRDETATCGAVLIFDEVKTSRCGPGGMQGEFGIRPDMTTLGKYIGGGLPSGAFGGRRDIMARYDPADPKGLRHAGTFNNNPCSLAAGLAGLTQVYTPARARAFQSLYEDLRQELNEWLRAKDMPMQFIGRGSLFTAHFSRRPIRTPRDIPAASRNLGALFHLESLAQGVALASRGDVFASLPAEQRHRDALRDAVRHFTETHGALVRAELGE
jgi:glutamate-1-semialdehyde 2,1-aminomutase